MQIHGQIQYRSADDTIVEIPPPERNDRRRVDKITLELRFTVTNSNVSAAGKRLGRETFWKNTRIKWFFADGEYFVEDVDLLGLEFALQELNQGYPDNPVQCADTALNAATVSGAPEVITRYFDFDLALIGSRAGKDFGQSQSELGRIIIMAGDTEDSEVKVTKVAAVVSASGPIMSAYQAGARLKFSSQESQTPLKTEKIQLGGEKIIAALVYSVNVAISAISSTSPKASIDSKEIVSYQELNTLDIVKHRDRGGIDGLGFNRASITETGVAAIVYPGRDWDIGDLPKGDELTIKYATNAGTATHHRLVMITVPPRSSRCRRRFPGAKQLSPQQLDQFLSTPVLDPSKILPSSMRPFLPELVRTSEVFDDNCG